MVLNILSRDGQVMAGVHGGKLVSLGRGGFQYFHGAEKPDQYKDLGDKREGVWGNSEIVMFPIVGPVAEYEIREGERVLPMDQHGVSRHLPFSRRTSDLHSVSLVQRITGEPIRNTKVSLDKKNPKQLSWPFFTEITKNMSFGEGNSLDVNFGIDIYNSLGGKVKYHFGWHPAFRTLGPPEDGAFYVSGSKIKLSKLAEMRGNVIKFEGVDNVGYINEASGREIHLHSGEGFKDIMIWTPNIESGMFCIEPVTHLPTGDKKYFLDDGDCEVIEGNRGRKNYGVSIGVK